MRLSVIIPAYNAENSIVRCLSSIVSQSLQEDDYEIIVVNDGSIDNTGDILRNYASKHKMVRVIEKSNGGVADARNKGLDVSRGSFILFVDADDYLEPNVLLDVVNTAETNQLDLISFLFYHINKGKKWHKPINSIYYQDDCFTGKDLILKGVDYTSVWRNLYSSSLINGNGFRFLNTYQAEDVDFNLRVYLKANRVMLKPLFVYNYNGDNNDSMTRGINLEKRERIINSNLIVAAHIKGFIRSEKVDNDVFLLYDDKMNSMIISQFREMFFSFGRDLPMSFIKEYLNTAIKFKVYPINGFLKKKKKRLARWLVNCKPLLYCSLLLTRRKNNKR